MRHGSCRKPLKYTTGSMSRMASILKEKRGLGGWLWKPYFIQRVLDASHDGDVVLWVDSDILLVNPSSVSHIFCLAQNSKTRVPIATFHGPNYLEKWFTKRSTLEYLHADNEEIRESLHIVANVVCIRNSESARAFVANWLLIMQKKELLFATPRAVNGPGTVAQVCSGGWCVGWPPPGIRALTSHPRSPYTCLGPPSLTHALSALPVRPFASHLVAACGRQGNEGREGHAPIAE